MPMFIDRDRLAAAVAGQEWDAPQPTFCRPNKRNDSLIGVRHTDHLSSIVNVGSRTVITAGQSAQML